MADLSTAAWVAHDLGLAAGFGGNLFGMLAMNPSAKVVDDERERALVVQTAWNRYRYVAAVGLAAATGTWIAGRLFLSGREVSEDARALTLVKDALIAAGATTGIASLVAGSRLGRQTIGKNEPVYSGVEPSAVAGDETRSLQRTVNALGVANIAIAAGVIAVTALLAMRSGESSRWSIVSRWLP